MGPPAGGPEVRGRKGADLGTHAVRRGVEVHRGAVLSGAGHGRVVVVGRWGGGHAQARGVGRGRVLPVVGFARAVRRVPGGVLRARGEGRGGVVAQRERDASAGEVGGRQGGDDGAAAIGALVDGDRRIVVSGAGQRGDVVVGRRGGGEGQA